MTGAVDTDFRALLIVRLRPPDAADSTDVTVWVDTGFTGDLVLSRQRIAALGLSVGTAIPAILADGSKLQLDTFRAQLDWFGEWRSLEVIANDGQYPLLGTGLLRGHKLTVDYATRTLTLD